MVIQRFAAGEVDAMWSSVGKKSAPRWLWHAGDHYRGVVLAYVFGRRKDAVLRELKQLLQPFWIEHCYTAHRGAYARQLEAEQPSSGNRQTQLIERNPLTFRTRIKR